MIIEHKNKSVEITNISDWVAVSTIPTKDSAEFARMQKLGKSGCYMFARVEDLDSIGDSIIHEKIGYTGKSKDVVHRTYEARRSGGSHGVARVCRQNNWNRDDVFVRYIYCDSSNIDTLESYLHSKSTEEFGKRFAWQDASMGKDGYYSIACDTIENLSFSQICDLIAYAKEMAREKALEEIEERLDTL